MSAFDQFMTELKQPLVANSPVPPKTTSFLPVNSPKPAVAAPNNKWMAIVALGALSVGMWWMSGGFGLGTSSSSSAAPSKSRRRRSSSRKSAGRRRSRSRGRSSGRRRSYGRKKVTFGW